MCWSLVGAPFGLLAIGGIAWALVQRRSRLATRAPADLERGRRLLDDRQT